MIVTGASNWSTAGYGQFMAYKTINKNYSIKTSRGGTLNLQFGIGSTSFYGSIDVQSPVGDITFHVFKADTPFLLGLKDKDRLGLYFNNLENELIKNNKSFPIIRQFGYPFLVWQDLPKILVSSHMTKEVPLMQCFLTDQEIRQLHRWFGHSSAYRLFRLLKRSGHEIDHNVIKRLTNHCHFCQTYGKSSGRFKFTLKDDVEFNHTIFVDVVHIDGNPVLHIVDKQTKFQAARWLKNMTAQHT